MFDQLKFLRRRLSSDGELEIFRYGEAKKVSFHWFPIAERLIIEEIESRMGKKLPPDYIAFLTDVSNGATLFYDIEYGQRGYKIYGTDDLFNTQEKWHTSISKTNQPNFVAFGEFYGDANVLLFDLDKINRDSDSCSVVIGNAYDPTDMWEIASRSFHEWLDHLITAQGAMYWEWK